MYHIKQASELACFWERKASYANRNRSPWRAQES